MQEKSDAQLLNDYADQGSQAAFGEVGIVQADHRRPVARLLMDFCSERQFGGRAEINELPGD